MFYELKFREIGIFSTVSLWTSYRVAPLFAECGRRLLWGKRVMPYSSMILFRALTFLRRQISSSASFPLAILHHFHFPGPEKTAAQTGNCIDVFLRLLVLCCRSLLTHWHDSCWADWPAQVVSSRKAGRTKGMKLKLPPSL